ncbi:MAG: hypothetical protein Q9227_004917 [Pyrenula ochraceoflavens]
MVLLASMFDWNSFDPQTEIPDLSGKTIIVTGGMLLCIFGCLSDPANFQSQHNPEHLICAARSESKALAAIADIKNVNPSAKVSFLELDLSSFKSVKAAADAFLSHHTRLDLLFNNAGIMAQPPFLTADGFEGQFGVNHMGHFLFTRLLLPKMQETARLPNTDVRIINLSSGGHRWALPGGGWIPETVKTDMHEWSTWRRYGQSKLTNILFTRELARRYPEITSVAIHPGSVETNLGNGMVSKYPLGSWLVGWVIWPVLRTAQNGALNQLWAAVAERGDGKKMVKSGAYYVPLANEEALTQFARDDDLARRLWEWSAAEVEERGY